MSEEPFILCDGLVKIYKIAGLEQVALRELNLTIEKGELMSIVGAILLSSGNIGHGKSSG